MAFGGSPHGFSKVKGGFLWIIIVHKNHTSEVNELAVKTGLLPTGTVNCKLLDVEAMTAVAKSKFQCVMLLNMFKYQ
jgi:hypothetical protein